MLRVITRLETLACLNHVQRAPARAAARRVRRPRVLRCEVSGERRGGRSGAALVRCARAHNEAQPLYRRALQRQRAAASGRQRRAKRARSKGGAKRPARGRAQVVDVVVRLVLVVRPNQRGDVPHAVRALRQGERREDATRGSIAAPSPHAPRTPSARPPASSGCPAGTPRARPAARRAAWAQCRRKQRALRRAPPASPPAAARRNRSRR